MVNSVPDFEVVLSVLGGNGISFGLRVELGRSVLEDVFVVGIDGEREVVDEVVELTGSQTVGIF